MGLFGMSEQELKKFAAELTAKEVSLKNLESDINLQKENIAHERKLLEADQARLSKEREEIATESEKLEVRRQEVIRKEAEAKAGFAKAQEDAFREIIETRFAELDSRQKDLDKCAARVAGDMEKVAVREGEVSRRELAVTEREQRADAGFADKAAALAAEAKRQHEANLQEANRLKQLEDQLAKEKRDLLTEKEAVRQREKRVAEDEMKRDAGYADERAALDSELDGKRVAWQNEDAQKRGALEKELADRRIQKRADMDKEVAEQREKILAESRADGDKERERILKVAKDDAQRIRDEIAREREAWEAERELKEAELKKQNEANEKKHGELSAKEDELLGKEQELRMSERRLENERDELPERVKDQVAEYKDSLSAENEEYKKEIQRLRDSLLTQTELLGAFEQLRRQLGDKDPAEVLRDLNAKTDEIKRLREDLASRPSEEMRERYNQLESQVESYRTRAEKLEAEVERGKADVSQTSELRRRNDSLESENKMLEQKAALWESAANEAQAELKRLRAAYERPAEVEARYKEIEMPLDHYKQIVPPSKSDNIDEITWLKGIGNACDAYGLHFPDRILKAFHTALKTAEWSPITVLAGVSGTGKSKLPELYSHFGGLLFEPLAVQPNWDSQESMLGFFNSIDNKFDAQPILRFLAQSQKPFTKDEYPGLADCVCMVLLDEMNLAHPELYFAEFLSKLEQRRGKKGVEVPTLPVKIGAGLPPYLLPLGRNVLWTGTMNQDETTKSLSDKVLDRSIVIHFPRPTELIRRKELQPLDANNRSPLLHKKTYFSWWTKKSEFSDEQVRPYKKFVERINEALGIVGRAIGHRVWQSVEYYMANYPDVRVALKDGGDESSLKNAMHIAFEDQLVQKVMPKLRGIDTRGDSMTHCLGKIRQMLCEGVDGVPFRLDDDFGLACRLGYGQFMWQSANYLNEDVESSNVADQSEQMPEIASEKADVDATRDANRGDAVPPEWFRPGNPKREIVWSKYSPEKRAELIESHDEHGQRQ